MGDRSDGDGEDSEKVGEEAWAPAEQALLDAALEFYGAAEGVIDYAGPERPQLRQGDTAGFDAVRRAMALLEERVAAAHAAGTSPERIAQITRIEQETIVLILQRQGAAPSPTES
ncbi:MAG TPA: hypothetical protein VKB03_07185 [Conexibacter sp.]|nr:hypothetical protein [Conexibacter sp.]